MSEAVSHNRLRFSIFAIVIALLVPVWFFVAAFGTKSGWWDYPFGLVQMTFTWGPMVIAAAGVVAVIAVILGLIKAPRLQPTFLALIALLIVLFAGGRFFGSIAHGLMMPPVHDIQTNWDDPIMFSDELTAIRGAESNPVVEAPVIPQAADDRWPGMGGRLVSEVQQEAERKEGPEGEMVATPYPVLDTLVLPNRSPQQAFEQALKVAGDRGWDIVTADADGLYIEATETSGWFGFKDDVAIKIGQAQSRETIVDMRSVSRVGLSDLGANAKRIDGFLRDLKGTN